MGKGSLSSDRNSIHFALEVGGNKNRWDEIGKELALKIRDATKDTKKNRNIQFIIFHKWNSLAGVL